MDKNIIKFIFNLPKIESIEDSIKVFKIVYNFFTTEEWLVYDNLLNISNAIAKYRPDLISVGIRLNVQINLFLRTILNFSANKNDVITIGDCKDLGCFALTETQTGVLSGLRIDTIFIEKENSYLIDNSQFNLGTENKIKKNWISQGIYAKYILIFAKNKNNEKDIRIFLVDSSKYSSQIIKTQIKDKNINISNYLDLAQIEFFNLDIPKNCLLEKTRDISKTNLLDSIYYGRIMIAEAVAFSIIGVIDYCENLIVKHPKLIIHQSKLDKYKNIIELLINDMIFIRNYLVETKDINRINSYKIHSISLSITLYSKLMQLFGIKLMSYPLKFDDLILNKVAEGDTDVLRLSLINNEIKKGFWYNVTLGKFSFFQLATLNGYRLLDYVSKKNKNNSILLNEIFNNKSYYSNNIIKSNL